MSKVNEIVLDVLRDIGESENNEALINASEDTRLLGGNGHLDSMGVVLLVGELEGVISEELGVDILLADERAMSRRSSPFRSVKTLCSYIEELIAEEKV